MENRKAALEALLFTMGSSVETGRLAEAIGLPAEETMELLLEMESGYESEDRGIRLIELDGSWQLCTKKEYYETLVRLVAQPKKPSLTPVLMETLSIIAYKQPVTRIEIEKIRGVKSDHAVSRLVEYGLVEEVGRLDAPGRPLLFGTSEEFLRHFGMQSVNDLPPLDPGQKEQFRSTAEQEIEVRLKV